MRSIALRYVKKLRNTAARSAGAGAPHDSLELPYFYRLQSEHFGKYYTTITELKYEFKIFGILSN